jgi:hypothetical protein
MSPIAKRAVKIREARDLLTGKRVNLSEMYTRDALVRGLGTAWVVPGEGSTWRELNFSFHTAPDRHLATIAARPSPRTNLKLTGAPLTEDDQERWESGNVQ